MLKFHRIEAGRYQADTSDRRYVVAKYGKGWLVTCWTVIDTAGIKHTVGAPMEDTAEADTKKLAVDIAKRYDHLVTETDYGRLFTETTPMRKALRDAYEAENARVRALLETDS